MEQCPQCGGEAQPDPESSRVRWCLSCWHTWALPREHACLGRRPALSPGLRKLDEYRDLRR